MSFEALKEKIDLLPDGDRRRLLAYLVALEDAKTAGHAERLGKKIEDETPGRWLTMNDLDRKLGLNAET